ncbi:hypothetical protein GCM10008921_08930 [Metaclostridioides mangenotii]
MSDKKLTYIENTQVYLSLSLNPSFLKLSKAIRPWGLPPHYP